MARIVVVGSLNMDLVAVAPRLPARGETLIGTRHFTAHGGKGANQAYAAARLGGDVAMIGRVGQDAFGESMRANLSGAGCDVQAVRTVPGPSGVALILVSDEGDNSIVVAPGANHVFAPQDLAQDSAGLAQAGLLLLQLESPMDTVIAAARRARAAGAMVVLDPAPAVPALPSELLAAVDWITPNETEACLLAGRPAEDLSPAQAWDIARRLQGLGARGVIVKLGGRGCLLVQGERAEHIPAPQVTVADTTAAGDTFNAALAVALSEGASMAEACAFAVRAAALSVTAFGAQSSMPDRATVDAFCAQHPVVAQPLA